MTTKLLNSLKVVVVSCVILFSIIACEKDFENIGVGLVDNDLFNAAYEDFNVVANTTNIEASRVDGAPRNTRGLPRYIIGVYEDESFGKLEASYVAQLNLSSKIDFGLNPVIDEVVVDIPYYSTRDGKQKVKNPENTDVNDSITTPKFKLDSIYGDIEKTYELRVSELSTFLNSLDPNDPSKAKRYYSNEEYELKTLLGNYNSFKPNVNDTVLYVYRPLLKTTDTIKKTNSIPSLKLNLDKDKIKSIFLDNASSTDLASVENFTNYFRGIMIEAIENGNGGSVMTLNTPQATFTIYYTNTVLTDETTTDLNNDGDVGDKQVPVLTKQSLILPMSGITTATYKRDYTNSKAQVAFNTKNSELGQSELFLQGAGGSQIEIDLFKGVDLDELRSKNWLINGAVLDVYVKSNQSDIPNKLYLYNLDNNTVIKDVISEGQVLGIDGGVDKNDDGEPIKYRFLITDYISDVLKSSDYKNLNKLALKTFHSTDLLATQLDTIIKDFSWNPRGVVLHGNKLEENVTPEDKKLKLRIYYTESN